MIKVYANGHEPLAYEMFKFSGGEIQIRLIDRYSHGGVHIEANIMSSDDLMTVLLLTDALKRQYAHRITLEIPYLPYSRQDRVCAIGEALSIKVFAAFINAQDYAEVVTWDAHSDVGPALINRCRNIPPDINVHLTMVKMMTKERRNIVLVAPDAGAIKKVNQVAKYCKLPYITASKIRDVNSGEISGTSIDHSVLHHDTHYLIVDDICDGGRTFVELAKELRKASPFISLYVTHGIFSRGFKVFESLINHIYCANPMHPLFNAASNCHKV